MSDWDADSEQLRANLRRVLLQARDHALERRPSTVELAREWQSAVMQGLTPPQPEYVGRFRGEASLKGCEVAIGTARGTPSGEVAEELRRFEEKLQRTVEALDALIAPGQELSADEIAAVIDLCAWAHAEWVRIHPFANGNGRTARLWANCLAMRYGLPPFVRLRPRPGDSYGGACAKAMEGQWQAMVPVFREMYRKALQG
jgi:Fic family protein